MKRLMATMMAATLAGAVTAQVPKPIKIQKPVSSKPAKKVDDFKREGNAKQRARKDPLEGKAPPPLQVTSWMNVKRKKLSLGELKGSPPCLIVGVRRRRDQRSRRCHGDPRSLRSG